MRIAVDIMGGDLAPRETVRGCVEAAGRLRDLNGVSEIAMVGQESAIRAELASCGARLGGSLSCVHASEAIGMDEAPAAAVRRKRDNSISRCMEMMRDGEAQAMVSAGNSGGASSPFLSHPDSSVSQLRTTCLSKVPCCSPMRCLLRRPRTRTWCRPG